MTLFDMWFNEEKKDFGVRKFKRMVCSYYKKPMDIEHECEYCPLHNKCNDIGFLYDFFYEDLSKDELRLKGIIC